MEPRTASPAVVIAALSLAAPGLAGLSTGAYASWTNTNSGGGFAEDFEFGSTAGQYVASVTDASANLTWTATTATFTGFADGGDGITSRSRGVAELTFASDVSFSITYGMTQLVGAGNQVGWGLIDIGTGESVLGLSFDGGTAISIGGVGTETAGTHGSTVGAGTYWLVMIAECTEAGGFFAYDATFTAVPAPGTLALVAGACLAGGRRRR